MVYKEDFYKVHEIDNIDDENGNNGNENESISLIHRFTLFSFVLLNDWSRYSEVIRLHFSIWLCYS